MNVLVAVHLLERAQVGVVGGTGDALRDAVVNLELEPKGVSVGAVETRVGVLGLVLRRLKVVDKGVLAAGVSAELWYEPSLPRARRRLV